MRTSVLRRSGQLTVDARSRRQAVSLLVALVGVSGAWLAAGAAVSAASTTPVYWDANGNLSADPTPFGGGVPAGTDNSALGLFALSEGSALTGSDNVAGGVQALASDTSGIRNSADGYQALIHNTSGAEQCRLRGGRAVLEHDWEW